jgi:hypothetical protein
MKTSNRSLIGFGIAIALLVITTIVLVFTVGKTNPPLLSEDTPEGTVQRYLQAIQSKNYQVAYAYLLPPETQTPDNPKIPPYFSYNEWLNSVQNREEATWKATLGKVSYSGETASIEVLVNTFRPGGPFGNPVNSHSMSFFLKKVDFKWLITSPTDLYWLYW